MYLAVAEVLVVDNNTAMVGVAPGQTSFGLKFAPALVRGPYHPCTFSPAILSP